MHTDDTHYIQIPDEKSIVELAEKLKGKGIDHKLWIEQPENVLSLFFF